MSEVKRFWCHEARNIRCVREADYDALAAEAQALREEVAALKHSQQVLIGSRNAHRDERDAARKEVAALRARVVVTPDASTVYAALDARERLFTSPENIQVALEAQSRLNGKTVSEGLLRRIAAPVNNQDELDAVHEARIELRALLNQEKENGNG
ncbi:hypothetical protein [Pseudomonas aeruginosa]|uniref:hypothetical protein n=1 Tax=Pseudomonas aeruginosa TaxID=287 RepID=UPI000FD4587E|nr:hypothetical protein [Pseudomonas aeruginosa]MDV8060604.1 hypothetical protein [Pseudomonas aeruginosa]MDV8087692.1 hypothetical protein [Pseudomonas aeruginosa]RUF99406.1 hypothetical protein IPC828_10475 [Pseudomonas aeruginosa]HEJ1887498.1 hypothetical protein [Pseudomonas aeruginosa]